MNYFKLILLNPISVWLKYLFTFLLIRFKENNVFIDYMSFCNNVEFGNYVTIGRNSNINNCSIGSFTYTSSNCLISNAHIGKFCSIGSHVKIGLGRHPTKNFTSTHPVFYSLRKQAQISFVNESFFEETQEIVIGNDVWIGANVIVLDGVVIGDGAIISAGAIVNKDVPPFSIYGGVPAKFIKYRFEESDIGFLKDLKWWDKDWIWLQEHAKYFKNVKELIYKINNNITC
jgi:acetyltransferase-like isoleucine patch superfamily enzyme